jgi:hypothetical protein
MMEGKIADSDEKWEKGREWDPDYKIEGDGNEWVI